MTIIIITIITIRNIIFSIWNNEPTPYKSIFFISLIRDRTKTRAEGDGRKKNWHSKRKVAYFLLKAYNQTRNFIKKSKSMNKKFFRDISLKGPFGPKLQYTTPHVRLIRDRLRKTFLELACERDF